MAVILTTQAALCGIPTGNRVRTGGLFHPLGWYDALTNLGSPSKCQLYPGSVAVLLALGLYARFKTGGCFPVG